jgi:hypothetical protein
MRTVPALTSAAACRNHLDREAIGVCIECRARVCGECVTKVDGINYCVTCLAKLTRRDTPAKDGAVSRPSAGVAAMVGWVATATLLLWGLLEVALPGSHP